MNTEPQSLAEAVQSDPALQAKVEEILANTARDPAEGLAALASERGLTFDASAWMAEQPQALGDDQLEEVAGGTVLFTFRTVREPGCGIRDPRRTNPTATPGMEEQIP
ncbi:MAG: Nif11-like leader peptide family natural product precursor [Terrimicrobiaceae bacterium]|nr:Nif11-like leader peptide family natural product precursor [Terrimicrobiaceae bacterium]